MPAPAGGARIEPMTGAHAAAVLAIYQRPGDTGHIAGIGVAYTAMLTTFYVDNGPHLPLWDRLPTLAFWLLPFSCYL